MASEKCQPDYDVNSPSNCRQFPTSTLETFGTCRLEESQEQAVRNIHEYLTTLCLTLLAASHGFDKCMSYIEITVADCVYLNMMMISKPAPFKIRNHVLRFIQRE
jgi:hypothetical protein